METIALFGGSFDPPHIGHICIVKALTKLSYIDKVVIMPTYLNPFKTRFIAPSDLRLKWLKDIFLDDKDIEVSSYEVDLKSKIPTIQTVKYLKKFYKNIYLVIGADNLKSLNKWYKYDELKEYVTFIVATRENIDIPSDFLKLDIDEEISSSLLRENIDISKLPTKCAKEIQMYYKENNDKKNRNNNSITRQK